MKGLNLSKFKKISSDEKKSVLRNEDGHEIHVAHSALKPNMKKKLDELPHYAQGAEVAEPNQEQPWYEKPVGEQISENLESQEVNPSNPFSPEAIQQRQARMSGQSQAAPVSQEPDQQASPVAGPSPASVSPQAQQQDQYGFGQMQKEMQGGYEEQLAGIRGTAQAEQSGMQERARIEQQYVDALKEHSDASQKALNDSLNERKAVISDYAAGHLNPDQFVENMSGFQKAKTAIGLILGGIAGGIMHQENPAMKLLNQQIDRDMHAQEMEIGKKQNLLSANLATFHDMQLAQQMTRMNLHDIYGAEAEKAGAMMGSQMAIFRGQQLGGALRMQMAPIQQQFQMRKAMMDMMGNTKNPEGVLDVMRITNPPMASEMQKRLIPGVGFAQRDVPDKAIEEIATRGEFDNAITNLIKFAKQNQGTVLNREKVNEGHALAGIAMDAYRRGNAQGVFREAEKNFVENIIDPDPTKFLGNIRTLPKYMVAYNQNRAARDNLIKTYMGGGRFNPQQIPEGKPKF